jgi:hypothetical protein
MSDTRIKRYFSNIQTKPPAVSGVARAVVLDENTGQQRYTDVEVGTQVIRVNLDAMAPRIAGGDVLRLEQFGSAANAEYRLAGVTGARPTSGIVQFMDDVVVDANVGASGVGGKNYGAGDVLIGSASATNPNFYYDYSDGLLALRTGSTNTIALDVTNGIRMYSGSNQRVAIKLDGSGWMAGSSTFAWDTAGNASFAGNLAAGTIDIGGADTTSFHVNAAGEMWLGAAASSGAPFRVASSGSMAATSGSIGGWSIGATTLTGGNITLDAGKTLIKLGGGNLLSNASFDKYTGTIDDGSADAFSSWINVGGKAVTGARVAQQFH